VLHLVKRDEERLAEPEKPADAQYVQHVRAADYAVSIAWRWGSMLVIVVGFGVTIGLYISQSSSMEKAFVDFKNEIRGQLTRIETSSISNTADVKRLEAQVEARGRELDKLSLEVGALRERIQNAQTDIKSMNANKK